MACVQMNIHHANTLLSQQQQHVDVTESQPVTPPPPAVSETPPVIPPPPAVSETPPVIPPPPVVSETQPVTPPPPAVSETPSVTPPSKPEVSEQLSNQMTN